MATKGSGMVPVQRAVDLAPAKFPIGGRGSDSERVTAAPPRTADDDGGAPARDRIVPEGYESEAEFLSYWIKEYEEDAEYDKDNRREAKEDLRFIYVDQWDEETRELREKEGRPCITVNTLPQFIGQVVGDRRINKTSIKVVPTVAQKKREAEVRTGLIKSIEAYSRAEVVYDACCEDQVGCGISNFEITLEYSRNDAFDQDIFIRQFHNPFAVTWDRLSRDPTGRDARHVFVEDEMPVADFKDEYGEEVPDSFPSQIEGASWSDWSDGKTIKVVAVWIMVDKPATFALMEDGEVEDVTDKDEASYIDRLFVDPQGKSYIKDGVRSYAQRWLITGFTILEGPYELPISRVPVIKVSGRVGRVGTKQYRFGLIRWARDPSLMRNYWRSIAVETLALAPRAQWIAPHNSVKGREDEWREAHLKGDPLLVYNTGKDKPQRVDPPQLPGAVLNEAAMNAQDIKDVTGIHDASLGIRSNEVSGKAIMARQREGDVATITFHDHLNLAIQEGGVVANELIPLAYDTTRTVRVLGIDDQPDFVNINDPADEESPDITSGKYDVQLTTGPSYTTQRMEAADTMLEAIKVMPEAMGQALDLVVEAQDWPGAEKIAARLKKIIPAAQQEEAEKQAATPEGQAAAQEAQAAQQQAQALQEAQTQAAIAEMEAKVAEAQARARKAEADAERSEADAERAREELRKARAEADRAEAEAEIADDETVFNRYRGAQDVEGRDNPPESSPRPRQSGGGSGPAGRSRSRKDTRK